MNDQPAEGSTPQAVELQEGRDYYIDNGLFVFTAAFLLRRGYCCESGCRHCPYDYIRQPDEEAEIIETQIRNREQ